MGTSQHLFFTIFRFSALTQHMASKDPFLVSSAKSELILVDQELASYQTNHRAERDMNIAHIDDAITSELYRLACRIHIRNLLDLHTSDEDSTVNSLVGRFIHQLKCLPPNSPSHSILSWPLVVAGFSATTNEYQCMIAARLVHIHAEWQSDVFSRSAAFLREKWKKDRSSPSSTNVTTMTRYDYNCPVILA